MFFSLFKKLTNKKGLNPFQTACILENDEITTLLINTLHISQIPRDSLYLLCKKRIEKHELVVLLLNKYATSSIDSSVDFLKQALYEENWKKQTIMHTAIENGHYKIVEILLRDFNYDGTRADSTTK